MHNFLLLLQKTASVGTTNSVWALLRIAMGILTIFHGYPKIMGGVYGWHSLGVTFMAPLGITFLPTLWGLLGALTEFAGGIMLTFGFHTRLASAALIIMMIIATAWHIQKGDSFNVYSLPLTLIFVYAAYLIVGSGIISIDHYFTHHQ